VSNKAYELMVDIFDTYTLKPAPLWGSIRGAPYAGFQGSAGHPRLTETLELLYQDVTQKVRDGIQPRFEEKHRIMWVHVPPFFDSKIWSWMENQFGATLIAASIQSTAILKPIDTTNLETMMEGYARQGLDMTMSIMRYDTPKLWDLSVHTYDHYNCDCMIITQHPGCKNICGAAGLFRKYLRKRGIPALFIEFDYNDDRVLSSEPLRQQIEEFFTTVMQ